MSFSKAKYFGINAKVLKMIKAVIKAAHIIKWPSVSTDSLEKVSS